MAFYLSIFFNVKYQRDLRMKEDTANLVLNSSQLDFVYVGLKLEVLTIGFTLGALLTG